MALNKTSYYYQRAMELKYIIIKKQFLQRVIEANAEWDEEECLII